jgi:hypothetical protein
MVLSHPYGVRFFRAERLQTAHIWNVKYRSAEGPMRHERKSYFFLPLPATNVAGSGKSRGVGAVQAPPNHHRVKR